MEDNKQNQALSMGKRIMQLRKAAGMTQEQLSAMVGVTPQAVSKWENDISCPDIATLPHLAEIFGVSTDALLGREDMDTEAVRAAYAKESSVRKQKSRGGIYFGILVAAAGLALLCGQFIDIPFQPWGVIWSAVLMGLGVAWVVQRFNFLALGVALLGLYYLMNNLGVQMPFAMSWGVALSAFLVLLGLTILWDHLFPHAEKDAKKWEDWGPGSDYVRRHAESAFSDEDGQVQLKSVFAENTYATNTPLFRGGNMEVRFGHGVLDMRTLQSVAADAVLHVEISFGSGEVWLPRGLRADLSVSKSCGDCEEHAAPAPDAKPIRIEGSVSFGSLEIHYS